LFYAKGDSLNSQTIQSLWQTTRPPFLLLTPICVLLGMSLHLDVANWFTQTIPLLILIGALAAHISVNSLNEYFDFSSGLDLKTTRTPFSGGSGALPNNPSAHGAALVLGIVSLTLCILIGLYFIYLKGSLILPIGVVGVAIVILYTKWINRLPWICLISPGLGFGTLMVIGTYLVLSGEYSTQVWLVSLAPFFLINNLLLLNQYPDIQADRQVGRRTFPIVYGVNASNFIYALFAALAYLSIVYCIVQQYLPVLAFIALLPALFSLASLKGAIKLKKNIAQQPQHLAFNVMAALLTPALLAVSIVLGD
jgi:1,4-dihydroxy-2-naphthoate polyprenyltransferase